jgi:hypothetical protein
MFTQDGAWNGPIDGATNANTVETSDLNDDPTLSPFWPWLFAQGVPQNIMLEGV